MHYVQGIDLKAIIHYATNCNKAVTMLKQSCNTLVTTLLQFLTCNFVAWWMGHGIFVNVFFSPPFFHISDISLELIMLSPLVENEYLV